MGFSALPHAQAQTTSAKSLTPAEKRVCKSLQHCLDIVETHNRQSFDYRVLSAEFANMGDKGRKALLKSLGGKNEDLSVRAAYLLNHNSFRFTPNEQRQIAAYWREDIPAAKPNALKGVVLQLYSPLMRRAAVSTLAHPNKARRAASQELIQRGEFIFSMMSKGKNSGAFKADADLFVPLSRGVMQDPTPTLIDFISAYPAHQSGPILRRLFLSDDRRVTEAAYMALKEQDSNAAFRLLVGHIKSLKDNDIPRAQNIGYLIATLNETRTDTFYTDFSSQLLADKELSLAGRFVGLDALLKQFGSRTEKDEITPLPQTLEQAAEWRTILRQVLLRPANLPSVYFSDLDEKLGKQFKDTAPLFWNALQNTSAPERVAFLDNFQSQDLSPNILMILNDALNDVTNWEVSAMAARILGQNGAVTTAPKLNFLAETHPIYATQVNAKAALDSLQGQNFDTRKFYWAQALLEKTPHCSVSPHDFRDEAKQLPFFDETKMAYGYSTMRRALTSAIPTDSGWLAGYDYGEFSGGLIAYDNISGEGNLIYGLKDVDPDIQNDYYTPNVIAIAPKNNVPLGQTSNEFWVITGLSHLIMNEAQILSVTKTGAKFEIKYHAKLPRVPSVIQKLNDGSLALEFGDKPDLKRVAKDKNERAKLHTLLSYNPPLRIMPSGRILRHCSPASSSDLKALP
jgi:hypothetical protein